MGWNDHIDDPPHPKAVVCPECKRQYWPYHQYTKDEPGFHWPSDMREVFYPCGHTTGKIDDHEHTRFIWYEDDPYRKGWERPARRDPFYKNEP